LTDFHSPRPIQVGDNRVADFECGEPSLNEWLKERALRNESHGGSRTFVSMAADGSVAGYYCLSASSLDRVDAPGTSARNMPDPIPVVLIGRLAVSQGFQRQRVGTSLLRDAISRALGAAETIGFRAFIVHALNPRAATLYLKFGFTMFPKSETTMFMLTKDAVATLANL
jgi:GNAT superfamily N-acetyltransferase